MSKKKNIYKLFSCRELVFSFELLMIVEYLQLKFMLNTADIYE